MSWFSLDNLGALVRRHSSDDTASRAIRRSCAPTSSSSTHADDIGLFPVTTETAEGPLPSRRRRLRETQHCPFTNLHPAGFDELMSKTIANATVDRLMHHAHLVLNAGDSIQFCCPPAFRPNWPLTPRGGVSVDGVDLVGWPVSVVRPG